ncbi:hypothetical protein HPB48_002715 [Haemaphysalis longicornis]|uniref:Uncharacterized protein n=1 Tax=Haemaphysalis longicornis TaxID=44386 RepID=A0A9J6FXW1_HAELO|nr:hypothetical protein HPB48_002715 [Haemaphysalis longicornis]
MDSRFSSLLRGKDLLRSTPSTQRDQQSDQPHPFGHGWYQLVALCNSVLAGVSFLAHVLCVWLASRVMDHWCQPPDSFKNLSAAEWKKKAIPIMEDGNYSHCTARSPPDAGEFARVVPCVSWTFDTDEYGGNLVSEWRLVCDRSWLLTASFVIYGVLPLLWLPILGSAADRAGRKLVATFLLPALLLAGFASAFTRSFVVFVALRLVVLGTAAAMTLILLVLLYEAAVPDWKTPICFLASAVMNVGATCLFFIMKSLKLDWRVVFLVAMIPTVTQISVLCTVHESYAWLAANCRTEEAKSAALNAARINGVSPDICWAALSKAAQLNHGQYAGQFDRMRLSVISPPVRLLSFLLWCIWFAVNFCYCELLLTDSLPLNGHVALAGGFCLAPAFALHYGLLVRFGTRHTTVASALVFSVVSIFLAGFYNHLENTVWESVFVAFMRVLVSVISSLVACLPFQAYPATTRCTGVSLCFAVGWALCNSAELALYHVRIHRRDITLFSVSLLMPLAAAAVHHLPSIPGDDPERSRPTVVASKDDVRRSYSDSLVPLPKGPLTSRKKIARLDARPEMFARRMSRLSLVSISERSSFVRSSSSYRLE